MTDFWQTVLRVCTAAGVGNAFLAAYRLDLATFEASVLGVLGLIAMCGLLIWNQEATDGG